MEFWGVEVKAGESLKIRPDLYKIIHVSQAALGEVKNAKGATSVPLRLKVGDKDYVIGNLSAEDRPQLMLDLVFEKQFELSHDWKNGSVYFVGYMADEPGHDNESDEGFSSEEDEEQELGISHKGNSKPQVKGADISSDGGISDEDSEPSFMEDSDFSDEDYSSDDTPAKDVRTKKRPSESAAEVPVPAKKAKLSTPEKKGAQKGQGGKVQPNGNKLNGQAPKSGGNLPGKANKSGLKTRGK